jgi:hypothetical protein
MLAAFGAALGTMVLLIAFRPGFLTPVADTVARSVPVCIVVVPVSSSACADQIGAAICGSLSIFEETIVAGRH